MSVKVHEAYSLDSFQDRLLWWDDFLGDQLQDEWAVTVIGTGTAVVVDAQTGGIVRITTSATIGHETYIDWGGGTPIRSLLVAKKVAMEFRCKLNSVADVLVVNRLFFDLTNYIGFRKDNALSATNWYIESRAVGLTQVDSGVAFDTAIHIFRVECHTHGSNHAHFYIDGTETANSPIAVAANIPTDYLMPYLRIITQAAATKSMDIDYVVVRQEI